MTRLNARRMVSVRWRAHPMVPKPVDVEVAVAIWVIQPACARRTRCHNDVFTSNSVAGALAGHGACLVCLLASDYGRRSATRKDTASAALRAQGLANFSRARWRSRRKILRPDLALHGPSAGPNLQCQKANRTGSHRPPIRKGTGEMTDTTTNQTERGTTAEEAQQPPQGTLEHLDPHALALETNVRDDAALDADFVASVKEHGVMNPIVAVRGSDGVVRVRAGQRRTLAARESGLATIPVYVRQVTDGDEQAQVVERVAEQIVENDQRQALTDAQRVRGIQQMLDAGVPVTKVAKTLSISRDIVKSAATAAGSAAAMDALNAGQLSLAEAAALTEFNDDPDAVARLLEVAGTGWFEHKVAEIRNQRGSDKAYAQAAEQFAAQGYTVLDEYPRYGDTTSFDDHCTGR